MKRRIKKITKPKSGGSPKKEKEQLMFPKIV